MGEARRTARDARQNPVEGHRRRRGARPGLGQGIYLTQPATAAIGGPAVGAGFDLALWCDLRIGTPSARFAHTFVDLGIIPGDGGAWLLPRTVGAQRAAELSFTGRMIDADEALEYGVLLEVVPSDELAHRVAELAQTIASKPAHSLRLTKRLLRHARTMDLDGFLDFTAALQAIAHSTDAHQDSVSSFLNRLGSR